MHAFDDVPTSKAASRSGRAVDAREPPLLAPSETLIDHQYRVTRRLVNHSYLTWSRSTRADRAVGRHDPPSTSSPGALRDMYPRPEVRPRSPFRPDFVGTVSEP